LVIRVGDTAEDEDEKDVATLFANATFPLIVGCKMAVAIQVPPAIPKLQVIKIVQPSRTRWVVAQTNVRPEKLGPNMEII
jgi:hypothetical protein